MQSLTRPLELIESEINFYKQQTATGIIEIGKRLIEAKEQLQHGEWGKWLQQKCDFTERTAQRFMKVANEFPTSMSHLGTGKLFMLLDVPIEEREQFIQDNKVDEMTTRQLQEAIKARKEAEQRAIQAEEKFQNATQHAFDEINLRINLENKINELESKKPEVIEKEIIKEITPPDYERLKSEALRKAELERQNKDLKNEVTAFKQALETRSLSKVDMLNIKNFTIDINHFLEKMSPLVYFGEQFSSMSDSEKTKFLEQIEKVEIACQDIKRAIDGCKGGANTIII